MSPPCFADLGKQAKDLFTKNYHLGIIKLDMKTKTPAGVEFTVNGTSNNDTGRVNATLETKKCFSDKGLTLKEKWNTDNTLNTELTLEDQIMKGLKLGLNGSFAPQSGKKTGTVKAAFKHDYVHLNTDVDIDYAGVLVHGAVVLGYQGWLAAAQLSFEPSKHQLTKTNFAIGYQTPDCVLTTNLSEGQELSASMYQRVNDQLEVGIQTGWSSANDTSRFGLGCVYKYDHDTSLRAKANNQSQIGLGFTHRLRRGISVTLCAMIDGKNFNQGGHKLGLGVDLEA